MGWSVSLLFSQWDTKRSLASQLICCNQGSQAHALVLLRKLVQTTTKSGVECHVHHGRVSVNGCRRPRNMNIILQALQSHWVHVVFLRDQLLVAR